MDWKKVLIGSFEKSQMVSDGVDKTKISIKGGLIPSVLILGAIAYGVYRSVFG
ncbi:hypothetical protein [Streptococcus danieliae]|uniref:hypothetical protein n=1 Tax=Streptococcus danieliae TaxID=747656 RepID=UPI0021CA0CE6|nr:hypothetical protein [Streptococcus danieliae]MCU0082526.1 hypothetical protein [Streptococcus danieliae]